MVVTAGVSTKYLLEVNSACREAKVKFISSETRGLFGLVPAEEREFTCRSIFCDFGNEFVVRDVNGEQPLTGMVASVTNV